MNNDKTCPTCGKNDLFSQRALSLHMNRKHDQPAPGQRKYRGASSVPAEPLAERLGHEIVLSPGDDRPHYRRTEPVAAGEVEQIRVALKEDFYRLYSPGFTADWATQRWLRGLEIEVMEVRGLLNLIGKAGELGYPRGRQAADVDIRLSNTCPKCRNLTLVAKTTNIGYYLRCETPDCPKPFDKLIKQVEKEAEQAGYQRGRRDYQERLRNLTIEDMEAELRKALEEPSA